MRNRLNGLLEGLGLSLLSLAVTLAALELVVFRYILVPDDELRNVTIDSVVRYEAGTRARFRHPDGSHSDVTINAQGWNSAKPQYVHARTPGVSRIAVIGDSYVHAKFVAPDESLAEVMERRLVSGGREAEVFRFGMDGAPLSQYLHVLRHEVIAYAPDVVVVPLIHNDFDETYRGVKTRYASSFLKLRRTDDGTVEEVPPATFEPGTADGLRRFATFRYLYYETNLYLHARRFVSRYFWGGEEDWDPKFIQSAVDIRKIADHDSNRFFARYVLTETKALADRHGFKLVFAMDGVREAVYAKRDPAEYQVGRLNQIARELTAELSLPFVDLQDAFTQDYASHGERFEFAFDWHWNRRGNAVVAGALVPLVIDALAQAKATTRKTALAQ